MKEQLKNMSIAELRQERERLADLLDEYREEREILLGQSGHHISSTGIVKKYAALIAETEESIADIEALIRA